MITVVNKCTKILSIISLSLVNLNLIRIKLRESYFFKLMIIDII